MDWVPKAKLYFQLSIKLVKFISGLENKLTS